MWKDYISTHPVMAAFAILVIGALLVSCTSGELQATSRTLVEAKIADILIQSGQPKAVVISADLTDGEMNQVLHAIETYQLVRERWASIVDDPAAAITNMATLQTDYLNLASEYAVVHGIAEAHWHEYSAAQQIQLAQYHARAQALGESIQQMLAIQDKRAALNTALEIGLTIAKIMAV